MPRIAPLTGEAVSQIHSSKNITSLQGVILALLENSLDSGASKVHVDVDFRRGGCTVEDNGSGIATAEFVDDGGLGRMYHTSKRSATSDAGVIHGDTGTYLASLAALSLLTITSHYRGSAQHASLVMHQGKVAARCVPAPASHELTLSATSGTRVSVRDLFGNMPVRIKQRALSGDSESEDERAWQYLKRGVAALLLAWPKPCAVRLHDVHNENRTLNIAGSHPTVSVALTERTLNQLEGKKTRFDLRDALPILSQIGAAPPESRQKWVPVSASAANISVRGFICLDPAPSRTCQFISIGVHACSTGSGHNELYEAVNKIFSNSSFGAADEMLDVDDAEKDRRQRDRRYKSDGYTQKQLQGGKGVDRHPMFVLQIKLKDKQRQDVPVERTSEASLRAMIDVLEATVGQWLTAHHFRPHKRRKPKNESQQGPAASSSPLRPSTAAPSTCGHGRLATPSLKRATTMASASTSKKPRIIDLSERPDSRGPEGVRQSPSTYFNGLSRIKSGRTGFYDRLWDTDKPPPALTEDRVPVRPDSPAGQSSSHPFKLRPLDVGELSSKHLRRATTAASRPSPSNMHLAAPSGEIETTIAPSSEDFGSIDDATLLAAAETAEKGDCRPANVNTADMVRDTIVDWTDPITKQTYKVNTRTGMVLPSRPRTSSTSFGHTGTEESSIRRSAAINTSLSSAGRPLSLARHKLPANDDTGTHWLPGFLKDWNNPVFAKQDEEPIPIASLDGPGLDITEIGQHRCIDHSMMQHFTEAGTRSTSKLSKAGLKRARVIRQVDDKFILYSMPTEDGSNGHSTLVLVDQHAASERVILESLLSELCAPADPTTPAATCTPILGCTPDVRTTLLDHPRRFLIAEKESELFAKHAYHFANWGILYDLSQTSGTVTASQVRDPGREYRLIVRALPPGISEQCKLSPNLLIELLRSEVWTVSQTVSSTRQSTHQRGEGDDHPWLRRIGSCPKGILDILNTRACRSAIMFNDVLSVSQCEELLADLSRCAFPFMCAHGRVSMVPLTELGDEGEDGFGSGSDKGLGSDAAGGFACAFRRWQDRESSKNNVLND